ncbi:MAG: hypothetical protein ACXVPQ_02865 [Bacteroidia bacterium]
MGISRTISSILKRTIVCAALLLLVFGFTNTNGSALKEIALDQSDSLYFFRKIDYSLKSLTYHAKAGDEVKITVINLDVSSTKTIFDEVIPVDEIIELKVRDLFEKVPNRSFIVSKINGQYYYKDVYINKYAGF